MLVGVSLATASSRSTSQPANRSLNRRANSPDQSNIAAPTKMTPRPPASISPFASKQRHGVAAATKTPPARMTPKDAAQRTSDVRATQAPLVRNLIWDMIDETNGQRYPPRVTGQLYHGFGTRSGSPMR